MKKNVKFSSLTTLASFQGLHSPVDRPVYPEGMDAFLCWAGGPCGTCILKAADSFRIQELLSVSSPLHSFFLHSGASVSC